jgi:RIO-like serine/threonine protein kinase
MMKPNIIAMFQQFMGNPMQMMQRSGLNIPQNIANDPNAIIQHLLSSGRMSQQQYNQLQQMANNLTKGNR